MTSEQAPPPRDPNQEDAELAKTAAVGCFAGMGVVGATILVVLGVVVAIVLAGAFLIFLTCSGH
ncbi:hypothetical protein [Sandaracinus amylolyticus]|uniref:hypothetical protein n=1 Tax=Sandaracinus amylolyticus TaxID=927083 RepID=UPI001F285B17|nr:hypothetical protein [Sandaracinus amylolyticus]UJR78364.1 Hypothetical protein I5071_3910 [Sandaracinus amylolyticus]